MTAGYRCCTVRKERSSLIHGIHDAERNLWIVKNQPRRIAHYLGPEFEFDDFLNCHEKQFRRISILRGGHLTPTVS
jgi:hypothetical protein